MFPNLTHLHSRRPSMECLAYRTNGGIQRCSDNLEDRLGEPIGACDHQTESMQKLVSRGLVSMTESQFDAVRNPALDFLKFVVLPPYAMDRIFAGWRMLKELDEPVTDVKREGICSFVYENLDHFLQNIPPGYPRKVVKVEHYGLSVFALIMGSVTLIATAITVAMIYMRTNKQVMKLAFIETIYATVIGKYASKLIIYVRFDNSFNFSSPHVLTGIIINYRLLTHCNGCINCSLQAYGCYMHCDPMAVSDWSWRILYLLTFIM